MKDHIFHIGNLESQEEAEKLTNAILHVWGIAQAETDARKKTVALKYDERMGAPVDFEQAIKEAGFTITGGDGE